MSKDAVLTKILALPIDDQFEVLRALQDRLAEELVLDEGQEREIERRMDRVDKEGFKGRPWKEVQKELKGMIRKTRNARHRN